MLASLGFEKVTSYINSGNLVFESNSTDDSEIAKQIHDAVAANFGLDISVMVRPMAEIRDLVANNPFEGQFEDDRYMNVLFLNAELDDDRKKLLMERGNENEMFAVMGRHVLCLLKISILDSAVGKGFIDKRLKVPATARNWRTVKKIAEM